MNVLRPPTIDTAALDAFEAGAGALASVLHLGPSDLLALRRQGVGLLQAGEFSRARAAFELLDAVGHGSAEGDLMIAMASERIGERARAFRYAARGLEAARTSGDRTLEGLVVEWMKRLEPRGES